MANVAVIERAYVGSGNAGRNTTLVRSNYLLAGTTQFFEYSLKLWEGLSQKLNYNVMLSQRGQVVLAHDPSPLDGLARQGNIMRLNGIDAELLDRGEVMRMLPYLDYSPGARFPILGGLLQRRAGTVRPTLYRGIALDLHPRRFVVGRVAQTELHHSSIVLLRPGKSHFNLYLLRSFAALIWDWLIDAALPIGYDVTVVDWSS